MSQRAVDNISKKILKILKDASNPKQRTGLFLLNHVLKDNSFETFHAAISKLLDEDLIRFSKGTVGNHERRDVSLEYNPYPKKNKREDEEEGELMNRFFEWLKYQDGLDEKEMGNILYFKGTETGWEPVYSENSS